MSDVIQSLRRLEFPNATKAALQNLETCFSHSQSGIPGLGGPGEELAAQIIQEFVFYQNPRKPGFQKRLSAIQELQVLEMLVQYFQQQSNQSIRHAAFNALFAGHLEPGKQDLLGKLVSMAIGVKSASLLDCAARWMQNTGCHVEPVKKMAETLVCDYCSLVPGAMSILKELPSLSPHFTCTFMTALTSVYQSTGKTNGNTVPEELLHSVTGWISEDYTLPLASVCHHSSAGSLSTQPKPGLWDSANGKSVIETPIPGLLRWCVTKPLHLKRTGNTEENGDKNNQEEALYSKLHLGILQTLLVFPSMNSLSGIMNLSHTAKIVGDLINVVKTGKFKKEDEAVQVAVERLAQAVQVAMATGALRCKREGLIKCLDPLPQNRLLSVLKAQYSRDIQPMQH